MIDQQKTIILMKLDPDENLVNKQDATQTPPEQSEISSWTADSQNKPQKKRRTSLVKFNGKNEKSYFQSQAQSIQGLDNENLIIRQIKTNQNNSSQETPTHTPPNDFTGLVNMQISLQQ